MGRGEGEERLSSLRTHSKEGTGAGSRTDCQHRGRGRAPPLMLVGVEWSPCPSQVLSRGQTPQWGQARESKQVGEKGSFPRPQTEIGMFILSASIHLTCFSSLMISSPCSRNQYLPFTSICKQFTLCFFPVMEPKRAI